MKTGANTFGLLSLSLLALLSCPKQGTCQAEKADWRKCFKHARYVIFSWDGSIQRYHLALLQNGLKGKVVDDMIKWREEANNALTNLQGCPPEYGKAREVLEKLADLLGRQEGFCIDKAHVMAHLEEWRSNRKLINQYQKELKRLLKL